MCSSAMPMQICAGTEAGGEPIDVRNHACKDDRKYSAPRGTREKSALQSERSEAMDEGIHGISGLSQQGRARHQQAQRSRDNSEFDWQARQRFSIDLRVDGIRIDGFADQAVRLPEINAFFFA